jgi:GNAT superfamily N-acetyltransferase
MVASEEFTAVVNLKIRKATRSDSRSFLKLVNELAKFERLTPPSSTGKRRLVRDTFHKKKLNLLLAFDGKRPIAYALYFFTYSSFLARPTLYLEDLFVIEDYRKRGVGKRLFLELVNESKRERCGRMEWAVLTWNSNAIKFYEKIGASRLDDWYYYRLNEKDISELAHN